MSRAGGVRVRVVKKQPDMKKDNHDSEKPREKGNMGGD